MFTRLADTYRRIRNTLRILLGNLYDFDGAPSSRAHPAVAGGVEGARDETLKVTQRDSSTSLGMTLIDRWILERLDEVIRDCRAAYEAFEFHKVYHTLNQFCAVDLSSLYIDITKDRMYCDVAGSPRRRATQRVMHEIFGALSRLLAPILAFTAEEAWRHRHPERNAATRNEVEGSRDENFKAAPRVPSTSLRSAQDDGELDSVHLYEFPIAEDRHREATDLVAELLRLRAVIAHAIERARQEKLIGNTLEARVVLHSDSDVTTKISQEELEEFFIVSDLTIHQAKEASASVTKTPYAKCARCWRHRSTVGASKAHPDLCDRCESVVSAC
jgi:isoleucyl-tRNA synthetase